MPGHQYAELARDSTLADEALEGVELDTLQQPAADKEAGDTQNKCSSTEAFMSTHGGGAVAAPGHGCGCTVAAADGRDALFDCRRELGLLLQLTWPCALTCILTFCVPMTTVARAPTLLRGTSVPWHAAWQRPFIRFSLLAPRARAMLRL